MTSTPFGFRNRAPAGGPPAGDSPGICDLMDAGPFDTGAEASAAARAVIPPRGGRAILTRVQQKELLTRVLAGAGVRAGRHDARIVEWLCGWDDATVAVIAGFVLRAAAALKPGTRLEWGVLYDGRRIQPCLDRDQAEEAAAEAAEAAPGSPARVVCRLTGSWRPA